MYIIVGATVFIGRVVTQKLPAASEKVRVVSRSAQRLAPRIAKGEGRALSIPSSTKIR
jgi:NAD dependent epimerase/dehydratase family enzyme